MIGSQGPSDPRVKTQTCTRSSTGAPNVEDHDQAARVAVIDQMDGLSRGGGPGCATTKAAKAA